MTWTWSAENMFLAMEIATQMGHKVPGATEVAGIWLGSTFDFDVTAMWTNMMRSSVPMAVPQFTASKSAAEFTDAVFPICGSCHFLGI